MKDAVYSRLSRSYGNSYIRIIIHPNDRFSEHFEFIYIGINSSEKHTYSISGSYKLNCVSVQNYSKYYSSTTLSYLIGHLHNYFV